MFASWLRVVTMAALLCSGAVVAAPFASVPSVAPVGQSVTVAGGGFTPGALVTLRIIGPNRGVSMAAVVAGDDGSISHAMVAPAEGNYRIQFIDAAGRAMTRELRLVASR